MNAAAIGLRSSYLREQAIAFIIEDDAAGLPVVDERNGLFDGHDRRLAGAHDHHDLAGTAYQRPTLARDEQRRRIEQQDAIRVLIEQGGEKLAHAVARQQLGRAVDRTSGRENGQAGDVRGHDERLDVERCILKCIREAGFELQVKELTDVRLRYVGVDEQDRDIAILRHAERQIDAREGLAVAG